MWEAFTVPGRSRWAEKEDFFIFICLWNGDLKQELGWAGELLEIQEKSSLLKGSFKNMITIFKVYWIRELIKREQTT